MKKETMKGNNSRKPNSRQKSKGWTKSREKYDKTQVDADSRELGESPKGPNDLSWYVVSDQILNDAARIPYNIPVGMPYARRPKVAPRAGVNLASYDDAIPGLMVSYVMPGLGNAKYAGDAVNVAANGVYQFVRSRISGSRNYDAVDMMVYLGAMDSIYYYVIWLTRLYGTIFTYHQANRYLSRALIESQGVDYDNLSANLAQFRSGVNQRLAKINGLYLPSILPLINRHSWLFSHYYIEGESAKDQIYYHVPAGIYYYTTDSDGAGMLKAHRMPNTPGQLTIANLLQALDAMIDPIFQDEDFNRISGDLLKAYEGNIMTVTAIPDIATVELMYNEGVLLQFKNAKYKYVNANASGEFESDFFDYVQDSAKHHLICKTPVTALDNYVFLDNNHNDMLQIQDDPQEIYKKTLSACYCDWSKDTILTSPRHDVVPGESMINTRLTLAMDIENNGSAPCGAWASELYFGSEWPLEYRLFCYHRNMGTQVTSLFWRRYDSHMSVGNNINLLNTALHSQLPIRSAYKYLPELTIVTEDSNANQVYIEGRSMFEVDNYAVVSALTIGGMHNAAILGEFKIPTISLGK